MEIYTVFSINDKFILLLGMAFEAKKIASEKFGKGKGFLCTYQEACRFHSEINIFIYVYINRKP